MIKLVKSESIKENNMKNIQQKQYRKIPQIQLITNKQDDSET
ncbi:hypothetical protein CLORAM_00861 [Thomasclavelia ramosa DSM 1402]|uniref:Uncharacterized protein n=1 Tax=Thomasclavelia ramosa DSM 1402 TaxID=445974 RepID=B0N343_9FIRM|nr:hypothetical protein CLORAM_00861 [Thomasclavelia ramosa DSM 1402]